MIIRSQDKTMIVNLKNIANLHISGKRIKVVYFQGDCADDIAEYSTEEKAIKVLDMICNFANEKHYEKVVTEQCGCIGGVVFEMPQDSEV